MSSHSYVSELVSGSPSAVFSSLNWTSAFGILLPFRYAQKRSNTFKFPNRYPQFCDEFLGFDARASIIMTLPSGLP